MLVVMFSREKLFLQAHSYVSALGNYEVNNNHSPFYISEVVCGNALLYIAE